MIMEYAPARFLRDRNLKGCNCTNNRKRKQERNLFYAGKFHILLFFYAFYACILIIYYLIPQKTQWVFLLMVSTAFYLLTGNGWLILYPAVASLTAYISMRFMTGTEDKKKRSLALLLSAALLIGALIVLKYINFGINTVNAVTSLWHPSGDLLKGFHFLVPLGISFYTFSILGYVVDVYNGIAAPQKNFF